MSARETIHLTDEQLDDYADGALDARDRTNAERHLESCGQCRSAVDETRAVVSLAQRERAMVTAPSELWPLVASSTIHLAAMRRQVLASMRGVLLAGAIALVAATAVVTWKVARWTAPRDVPAPTAPVRAGGPGRHAGHPTIPRPPTPPQRPQPPRPPDAPRP